MINSSEYYMSNSVLMAENNGDATISVCNEILNHGLRNTSSSTSMNAGKEILELFNCSVVISQPTHRIISNSTFFSPGFASARLLYLLTGSNDLEQIKYYTKGVSRFTDDGIKVPGSAYGNRLFSKNKEGITNFELTAQLIERRDNTKRAYLPIFSFNDLERANYTNDLPCAIGMYFIKRNNKLTSMTIMRANDALKVMPYNIFEFSFIGEIMATRLDAEYDSHVHTGLSMHLRDIGIDKAKMILESDVLVQKTIAVNTFNEDVRLLVSKIEKTIRQKGRGINIDYIFSLIPDNLLYSFYGDLLLSAFLYSKNIEGKIKYTSEKYLNKLYNTEDAFPLTIATCYHALKN